MSASEQLDHSSPFAEAMRSGGGASEAADTLGPLPASPSRHPPGGGGGGGGGSGGVVVAVGPPPTLLQRLLACACVAPRTLPPLEEQPRVLVPRRTLSRQVSLYAGPARSGSLTQLRSTFRVRPPPGDCLGPRPAAPGRMCAGVALAGRPRRAAPHRGHARVPARAPSPLAAADVQWYEAQSKFPGELSSQLRSLALSGSLSVDSTALQAADKGAGAAAAAPAEAPAAAAPAVPQKGPHVPDPPLLMAGVGSEFIPVPAEARWLSCWPPCCSRFGAERRGLKAAVHGPPCRRMLGAFATAPTPPHATLPAQTGFAGYWQKDVGRTTTPPLPCDDAIAASRLVRGAHESIPGILVRMARMARMRLARAPHAAAAGGRPACAAGVTRATRAPALPDHRDAQGGEHHRQAALDPAGPAEPLHGDVQ